MTQYVINIGTIPNDGTGDPLRTAFNEVNLNFDQVFAAGPVLSNIQIANNTILTTNTNGNLVLAPNGIGVVQANVNIVPNAANIRNLGSADRRWSTLYVQYANVSGGLTVANLTATGDVVVGGNLSVTGNVINIGNIITDAKTIQLANTAGSANAANGSGITVGANDNIATMLFNSSSNAWTTNIGISATGNIYGNFVAPGANGQVLYNRSGVIGASPSNFNFDQSSQTLFVTVGAFAGQANGTNALFVGAPGFTELGSDIMGQFTANVASYSQINLQNTSNAVLASGDYVITADNGTDSTYYLDMGLGSSTHDDPNFFGDTGTANDGYLYVAATDQAGPGASNIGNLIVGSTNGVIKLFVGNTAQANVIQTVSTDGISVAGNILPAANVTYSLGNSTLWWSNVWVAGNTIYIGGVPLGMSAGNVLTVGGNAVLSNDSNITITTTGNITADYFFGNGSQLTGLNTSSISNGTSNVDIPVANGNVTVTTAGAYGWTFDDSGNLTFPSNGQIVMDGGDGTIGNQSDDFVISWNNEEIRVVSVGGSIEMQADAAFRVQTNYDGANVLYASRWEFSNNEIVNISNNFGIVSEAGNLTLSGGRDGINSGNTIISSVNLGNAVYNWTFDNTGNLTTPQGMVISGNVNFLGTDTALLNPADNTPLSLFSSGANGTITSFWTDDIGNLMTSNIAAFYLPLQGTQTVRIVNGNNGGNVAIYDFDNTGMFTTGAVCATGNVYAGNVSASGNVTGGNILTGGLISATGNISGNYFIGNGSQLTGLPAQYGDANVASFLAAYGSNTVSTTGNITAGNFVGAGSNVDIVAGSYDWTFVNDGNLILPGNTFAVKYANGTAVSLGGTYGDSNVTTLLGNLGSNAISTTGNVTSGDVSATGNVRTTNITLTGTGTAVNASSGNVLTNQVTGTQINFLSGLYTVSLNASGASANYTINLPANAGSNGQVLTTDGNGALSWTTAASSYGNANVATFLASYGSNTISTTGNITAGNLIGNISITGNVQGTSANVTLVAGAYSTVFDNIGTATLPGPLQLAVYANTTVRDTAIPSPTPGMMIYVTGTGMQVRGATGWNTIAGSGT